MMLWLISGIILIGIIIHMINKDKEYLDKTEIQSMQELREEKEQERIRQECMEKNEKIIQESFKESMDIISTRIALANIGAERYGRPTVYYTNYKQGSHGKRYYNSTQLLNLLEGRNKIRPLTVDEVAICKTMKILLEEQMQKLGLIDENGKFVYITDDEVLESYATFIRMDYRRLEQLIKKNI